MGHNPDIPASPFETNCPTPHRESRAGNPESNRSGIGIWDNAENGGDREETPVGQYERLILMAEDELTQYSTDARKLEKLRQKIGLSVSFSEQQQIKAALATELPTDWLNHLIETQRQTVALPFLGIAGLGLLFGIALFQPLDFVATGIGGFLYYSIQRRGWRLQAKRLVLRALTEIEQRSSHPNSQ